MNNMKNFAAQQLSKKEMNNVKGGTRVDCYVEGQWVGQFEGKTKEDVEQYIHSLYGSGYCD